MLQGEQVAYITPTFSLGKTFFQTLLLYIPAAIIKTDNKSELCIELITGGSLKFFSGEALNNMRGRSFDYCVIDEAAFISDLKTQWDTSIRPTLSDKQGGCLFISTPRGKEFFYSLWCKGNDKIKDYQSWHYQSNDNPYFPKAEWESAKESIPSAQFRSEYMAIPGENQSSAFGSEYIQQNVINELSQQPTVVYGIDLAYTLNGDATVIVGLDINGSMTFYESHRKPFEYTKQRIESLPGDILKVIDATGIGAIPFQTLQQTVSNIEGFVFTSESKPKLIYELVKSVEKGEVKYVQQVADEMGVFEYKYSSTGHVTFGAQSGFHDDAVCALAIANRFRYQAVASSNWRLY